MNLPAPARALDVPRLDLARIGIRLVAINGGLWRVTTTDGRMLGHVEQVLDGEAAPLFRSKRFSVRDRAFRVLGEFRSSADAVDAVRFG